MKKMEMRYRKLCGKAAVFGLCGYIAMMAPCQSLAGNPDIPNGLTTTTDSNAAFFAVSNSNAAKAISAQSMETGDLWENWIGDLSFLRGDRGNGTEEKPFQISTKEHLMGLSELAAKGMVIEEGEGTYPGNYVGSYFVLTRNIDLGGMEWIPIGFYQNEVDFLTGEVRPFMGHFDGNGKTVSNFTMYRPEWSNVGLFGVLEEASVKNVVIKPGHVVTAEGNVGILGGKAANSVIYNVTVMGAVRSGGTAGGLFGEICEGTVVENCIADHVSVDSGAEHEVYTGGIAGKAAESLIVDCTVNTGDSVTARIQGDGYVGGVVGFQNGTDIFNVHVMGTIGGSGSQAIGGVTGKYASGKIKVARFEGVIADSGMGSLAREGTFIGTHDTGFHFRYGTEAGSDLAYLFADTEAKIAAGVCGSGIPDDNRFGYDAHIGFWHGKDNFFTLVQGQNTKAETERYFYEELERGVLYLIDAEEYAREGDYMPDHFAPNAVGRPARGFLVSVLQIDTAANVENYYDVASLTVRGESAYCKELDKDTRGAIAAGDVVTVMTAPRNTEEEKYQMDGVPTYTGADGLPVNMQYQTGGSYSFVMPAHDIEISAEYRKVAAAIRVAPEEFVFRVTQERRGDRKNPSVVTEVKDGNGKLIAKYINGMLEEGTKVQEVTIDATVDKNNDVADSRVLWSVDDSDLLILKKNTDEDHEGYTAMSASVELNLEADFFEDILRHVEKVQAESGYRYAIPDTIYGNGTQGGLAVLTAKTRPASSFEGKTVEANCRIPVTFQIKDKTYVGVETMSFDQNELEFTVTRTLTGNRKAPKEEIVVSNPQNLQLLWKPEFFDMRSMEWKLRDPYLVQMNSYDFGAGGSNGDFRTATIHVMKDAKWIQDLMSADDAAYAADSKIQRTGSGEKETVISAEAMDLLGNRKQIECKVKVKFVTVDETVLYGYYNSSGGSSGGLSGGSDKKNMNADEKKDVSGHWVQRPDGTWMYSMNGRMLADQWAQIENPYTDNEQDQKVWFRFDQDGVMCTGWFQEKDGGWYYLHALPDGNQGCMYTGWHVIDRVWYFFGQDGRMYYSTETPDGYTVNESGAWTVDGVIQTV